jgi:hypothetical protein
VNGDRLLRQSFRILLSGLLLLSWGCVHRIHVTPAPPAVSADPIAQSVQVIVPSRTERSDHMPALACEWPAGSSIAAIDYIIAADLCLGRRQSRFTLTVKAWLTMRSRGNYRYSLCMESDLACRKDADQSLQKRNGRVAFGGLRLRIRPPLQRLSSSLDDLLADRI